MQNIKIKEFPYSSYLKPILTEIFENINDEEFDKIGYVDYKYYIPRKGNFMDIGFEINPHYGLGYSKNFLISVSRGVGKTQYFAQPVQKVRYINIGFEMECPIDKYLKNIIIDDQA